MDAQAARPLLDLDAIAAYLTRVAMQYATSAPTVSAWADALYRTLGEDVGKVTVRELLAAQALYEEGQWEHPHLAANRIYKLLDAMGKDTTGQLGF